jgi:hypothetical protein
MALEGKNPYSEEHSEVISRVMRVLVDEHTKIEELHNTARKEGRL